MKPNSLAESRFFSMLVVLAVAINFSLDRFCDFRKVPVEVFPKIYDSEHAFLASSTMQMAKKAVQLFCF